MKVYCEGRDRSLPSPAPAWSTQELADEFGVSVGTLANYLKFDGPKPRMARRTSRSTKVTRYDPVEVRAWWAQRCGVQAPLGKS